MARITLLSIINSSLPFSSSISIQSLGLVWAKFSIFQQIIHKRILWCFFNEIFFLRIQSTNKTLRLISGTSVTEVIKANHQAIAKLASFNGRTGTLGITLSVTMPWCTKGSRCLQPWCQRKRAFFHLCDGLTWKNDGRKNCHCLSEEEEDAENQR